MKYGIRKPNIKSSIKARTTGHLKRTVKSISPTYKVKGIGLIKSPKKSIYNHIYNQTTVSAFNNSKRNKNNSSNYYFNNANNKSDSSCSAFQYIKSKIKSAKNIYNKRHAIPKKERTHYFSIKARCFICNKNLGLMTLKSRYQLIDGWLCMKCAKSIFGKNIPIIYKIYTKEDIKLILDTKNED